MSGQRKVSCHSYYAVCWFRQRRPFPDRLNNGGDSQAQAPKEPQLNALFSHGDDLFAGGYNDVFRSTDKGQSWKSVKFPETNPSITSFTAIGGTIFAGSSAWPLFRSNDNGLTWTRMEVPEDITTLFSKDIDAFPPPRHNRPRGHWREPFCGNEVLFAFAPSLWNLSLDRQWEKLVPCRPGKYPFTRRTRHGAFRGRRVLRLPIV